jgi:hypothetical protein
MQQPDRPVILLQPAGQVRHPAPANTMPALQRELVRAEEPVAGVDGVVAAALATPDARQPCTVRANCLAVLAVGDAAHARRVQVAYVPVRGRVVGDDERRDE